MGSNSPKTRKADKACQDGRKNKAKNMGSCSSVGRQWCLPDDQEELKMGATGPIENILSPSSTRSWHAPHNDLCPEGAGYREVRPQSPSKDLPAAQSRALKQNSIFFHPPPSRQPKRPYYALRNFADFPSSPITPKCEPSLSTAPIPKGISSSTTPTTPSPPTICLHATKV